MIFDAEQAARQFAGDAVSGKTSVVAIQTTRPKYLVFGQDTSRPACVVQFGTLAELAPVHRLLETLEPQLRGMIPAPLALERWRDELFVEIQSGLAGAPWFQLQRTCDSPKRWLQLVDPALQSLQRLQAVTARMEAWGSTVDLGSALDQEMITAAARGVSLGPQLRVYLDQTVMSLLPLRGIQGRPQHGDYSLNNVLLGGDGAFRVIDFDEFGLTSIPLQDEIGLALSLAALAPNPAPGSHCTTIWSAAPRRRRPGWDCLRGRSTGWSRSIFCGGSTCAMGTSGGRGRPRG